MGRPLKEGLDYFPHDTDAATDEKIEAMRALFGAEGYAFYFISLERIYRTKKGQIEIDTREKRASLVARIGVSDERFLELLEASFRVSLFDRKAFDTKGLLTSGGIKRRVRRVNEERERKRQRSKGGKRASRTMGSSAVLDTQNPVKTTEEVYKAKQRKNDIPPYPPKGDVDVFREYAGEDAALLEALRGFEQMRAKIKKPMTELARRRLTQKLDKLRAEYPGVSSVELLEEAILHCWQSVYPPKEWEVRREGNDDVL